MKDFDIDKCSLEELCRIKTVLASYELQRKVDLEYAKRMGDDRYLAQTKYRSSRLPNFDYSYLEKCNQLIFNFDIMRLGLLWSEACLDKKNNSRGDFYIGMFGTDGSAIDLKLRHNLAYLSLIFQNECMQREYECAYNAVNFVVNSIYKALGNHFCSIDTVDDLFKDFALKKEVVYNNFSNVIKYLRNESFSIMDSRLFVGNYVLAKNPSKSVRVVRAQGLIDAVAFGCSLDELQQGNYEGAKRLIYVPENKIRR